MVFVIIFFCWMNFKWASAIGWPTSNSTMCFLDNVYFYIFLVTWEQIQLKRKRRDNYRA